MAAACAGAVSAAALPPVHAVVVLVPTIWVLLGLIDAAATAAEAGRRGWWFGFGLHGAGTYWLTEAIIVDAERYWWLVPLAVPALATVLGMFSALAAFAAKAAPGGGRRLLAWAAAWTLLDIARQFVLTGFPWNPLGSVWTLPNGLGDAMIQPAAWVGAHGLTLATLLTAGGVAIGARAAAAAVVVLGVWFGVGQARLSARVPDGAGMVVVLVQGNIPQTLKWDRARAIAIFDRYLSLTRDAMSRAGTADAVVIWPETASQFLLGQDAAARDAIMEATGGRAALVGGIRILSDGRAANSLFALINGGMVASVYDKAHLVPFGEYFPSWLPFGFQLAPGGGFAAGPGPRTLSVPGVPPFGASICYEAIFPGQIVDGSNRPAWIVNVTNDAWFGDTSGPRQHLAAARLRGVEEGLPMVRVANTGISAVYDPFGRELGRIGLNTTGAAQVLLPGPLLPTPFASLGLVVPAGIAAVSLIVGLIPAPRRVI